MKPKKGSELELQIDRLVFGGKGIATHDGFKIFVADTVPGDRVRAQVRKVKSKYAEAKLLEVVEPSPLRVPPRCKHFDTCGGCKWQFLDYAKQCQVKEDQVRDAIVRQAGLSGELVQPILPCAEPWFYRNKMELSFGTSPESEVMLGFYPPGYHYEVFNLEECFLQSEVMAEIAIAVRDFANEHKIAVYNSETHEGLLRNLIIREGKNTGERMVILVTSTGLFEHRAEFVKLMEAFEVSSLYWETIYQVPGQPTWREDSLLAGKEFLLEALVLEDGRRLEFEIQPQAFFQTNTHQTQLLYSKVLELAELTGEETVFDLYCGTGTIGLFCANQAKQVYGVEVNEAAIDSAHKNAQRNGIKNVQFSLGSVEKRLADLKESPDVLIVDPPRAGLGEKVVEQVVAFGAERIVYVSCNPSTLARDLKQFDELGYQAQIIQPVDMFPQTSHIETVVQLLQEPKSA